MHESIKASTALVACGFVIIYSHRYVHHGFFVVSLPLVTYIGNWTSIISIYCALCETEKRNFLLNNPVLLTKMHPRPQRKSMLHNDAYI